MKKVLAVDLGASNGRVILGTYTGERIDFEEITRFENGPILVNGHVYTDILFLLSQIKNGLQKVFLCGHEVSSLAIDTWGADYGLLDAKGFLIENPTHYRDKMFDVDEPMYAIMPFEEMYEHTGIQKLPCDTLRQLFAFCCNRPEIFEKAQTLLFIPSLLNYFLTGKIASEYTIASTSALLDAYTNEFSDVIFEKLSLPRRLMPPLERPGKILGEVLPEVCSELNIPPVFIINSASHDTASAVISVPSEEECNFMFISSGTWTMLGTETDHVYISEVSRRYNISNEKGFDDTIRLLKNCSGFWIFQECIREWKNEGIDCSDYGMLCETAEQAIPHQCYIDVSDKHFFYKGNMISKIKKFCSDTGQFIPQTRGEILRTVFESLAMECAMAAQQIEEVTQRTYDKAYMVGGGVKNTLMCLFLASALGKKVVAGPAEATAIGNIIMQLISLGEIKDKNTARKIIRNSFEIYMYEPKDHDKWLLEMRKYLRIKMKDS